MKRFAFIVALTLVLVGNAYAQRGSNPANPGELWEGYSFSERMKGLETAKGIEDFEDDIIWGRSITMTGTLGEFTANINRSGIKINPETGHKLAGGTWTLHVLKEGQLRGMLFGEFTDGTIEWITDKEGTVIAEIITGRLVVIGGTGDFETKGGPQTSGVMTSMSVANPKGFPVHSGAVNLIF